MSRAIVLQHVAFETPGRIVPILRDFGIPIEVRKLYAGDEVPTDLSDLRTLIVLGGPMGVSDIGSDKYPFLSAEVELLQKMVALDRPVLGICLGAQLLAHAAGARVYPNIKMAPPAGPGQAPKPVDPPEPLPELGWHPVTFPFPGGTEPMVFGAHDGWRPFHWHFDTFDLPKLAPLGNPAPPPAPPAPTGNSLLGSSKLCRNQVYRFKTRLFGFQYHLEQTRDDIAAMLSNCGDDLVKAKVDPATIREQTETYYPAFERISDRILKNFVQFLKVY